MSREALSESSEEKNQYQGLTIAQLFEEIGFKGANLAHLSSNLGVEVPAFRGIGETSILHYLDTYAPEWQEYWQRFQAIQGAALSISPEAEEALLLLQQIIRTTFRNHLFPLPQQGMPLSSDYLMIRSSGNEDRVDVANPGGNASLVSENKPERISEAIGEVMASYFSVKSLSQRLLSGENITKQPPKLACLAQILIGETKEQQWPPVSGVMYTDGGNVRIQAAYGHGEYVVNSQGPVDNIWVTADNHVYVSVANKIFRLVSRVNEKEKKIDLVRTANASDLRGQFCLNTNAHTHNNGYTRVTEKLADIARRIEKSYGMRMDIEFVYDPNTNMISIVQARALPEGYRKGKTPNALSRKYMAEHATEMIRHPGEVITPDILFTATIENTSELIICQTIQQALNIWQNKKGLIKAVIIQEPSPDTSHEAGMFTSQAIPVLRVNDPDKIRSLLTEENLKQNNLVIDPQNNALFQVPKKAFTQTGEEAPIQEGLFKSTLTDQVSVRQEGSHYNNILEDPELFYPFGGKYKLIFRNTFPERFQKNRESYTSKEDIKKDLDTLISASFSGQKQEHMEKISNLVLFSANARRQEMISPQTLMTIVETGTNLMNHAEGMSLEEDAHTAAIKKQHYLDVHRKLEGLLLSDQEKNILSTSVLREILARKKEAEDNPPTDLSKEQADYYRETMKLGLCIVIKERRAAWNTFCAELCRKNKGPQLATFIHHLIEQGVHEYWVNVDFWKKYQDKASAHNALKTFASILKNYTQKDMAEKREQLLTLSPIIDAMEAGIAHFASSTTFDHNMKKLKEQIDSIEKILLAENVKNAQERDNSINQILSIHLTNRMVEAFDKSIKALQISGEYQADQKSLQSQRFKEMVILFMGLLEKRVHQTPPKDPEDKRLHLQYIKENLEKCTSQETELQISSGFNVMQANIFSGQNAENIQRAFRDPNNPTKEKKNTVADIHTSIHQSLISYSANKTDQFSTKSLECMPPEIQAIHQSIAGRVMKDGSDGRKVIPEAKLLSITFKNAEAHLEYNIPLRNHSANMQIVYHPKTKSTSLSIILYGRNNDRWPNGAKNGIALLTSKKIEVKKYFYDNSSLKFEVHAKSKEQINNSLDAFFKIAQATLEYREKMDFASKEITESYSFEQFWLQYNRENQVQSLQKEYCIVSSATRQKLLSEINSAPIPQETKERLRSDNNLFLLNMGALDLNDLRTNPKDPLTAQILDLSQQEFDQLTSMKLINFYQELAKAYNRPLKEFFREFMSLSLDEEAIYRLTLPALRTGYFDKIFSITDLANFYKQNNKDWICIMRIAFDYSRGKIPAEKARALFSNNALACYRSGTPFKQISEIYDQNPQTFDEVIRAKAVEDQTASFHKLR